VEALARAQAASEGVPDAEEQIGRLARAALDTDLVRTAVTGPYWRELYVAAPLEGVVVEGYVDLLYDDGEGLVIVDYKTDSVRSDDDATATADRYRHQLASYALVLEATTGRRVRGAALLFVAGGVGRTAWIDDLEAAKAEVSAWLTAAAGPPTV
jgi:ATP-dependent exoDNAse (exonuclease V) beta subunit